GAVVFLCGGEGWAWPAVGASGGPHADARLRLPRGGERWGQKGQRLLHVGIFGEESHDRRDVVVRLKLLLNQFDEALPRVPRIHRIKRVFPLVRGIMMTAQLLHHPTSA